MEKMDCYIKHILSLCIVNVRRCLNSNGFLTFFTFEIRTHTYLSNVLKEEFTGVEINMWHLLT